MQQRVQLAPEISAQSRARQDLSRLELGVWKENEFFTTTTTTTITTTMDVLGDADAKHRITKEH